MSGQSAQIRSAQIEAVYRAIEAHVGPEFIGRFYATRDEFIEMPGEVPEAGLD